MGRRWGGWGWGWAGSSLPWGGGEWCQHLPLSAPMSWAAFAWAPRMCGVGRAGMWTQGRTGGRRLVVALSSHIPSSAAATSPCRR